ncbi:MAG: hypothetical protein AAFO82_18945 [Bacteroidota bacterium]
MLIFLILIQSLQPPNPNSSNEYLLAYNYIIENDAAQSQIKDTFKSVLKKKELKRKSYCIDTFAYSLTINGFSEIKDSMIRSEIRKIDSGEVSNTITKFSSCNCRKTTFNMEFSVLNKGYMTVEIASRKFNPLGGSAFGPSIKFLFKFVSDKEIDNVIYQSYING